MSLPPMLSDTDPSRLYAVEKRAASVPLPLYREEAIPPKEIRHRGKCARQRLAALRLSGLSG